MVLSVVDAFLSAILPAELSNYKFHPLEVVSHH